MKPSTIFDPDDLVATLVGLVVGWGLSAMITREAIEA